MCKIFFKNWISNLLTHIQTNFAKCRIYYMSILTFLTVQYAINFPSDTKVNKKTDPATKVRQFLMQQFRHRLISRGCDVPWPARSSDLNPLDYWFWVWLKSEVFTFHSPVQSKKDLKKIIMKCVKVLYRKNCQLECPISVLDLII